MPVFGPPQVMFVRGRGTELWDDDGKRYLDFLVRAGGDVARPRQPGRHRGDRRPGRRRCCTSPTCSPTRSPRGGARRSTSCSPRPPATTGRCSSATPAPRPTRRAQAGPQVRRPRPPRRRERATAASTAARWRRSRRPASRRSTSRSSRCPTGFRHVAWGDLDALAKAVDPTVAAVLIEPVQGEGGVNPAPRRATSRASVRCATSAAR